MHLRCNKCGVFRISCNVVAEDEISHNNSRVKYVWRCNNGAPTYKQHITNTTQTNTYNTYIQLHKHKTNRTQDTQGRQNMTGHKTTWDSNSNPPPIDQQHIVLVLLLVSLPSRNPLSSHEPSVVSIDCSCAASMVFHFISWYWYCRCIVTFQSPTFPFPFPLSFPLSFPSSFFRAFSFSVKCFTLLLLWWWLRLLLCGLQAGKGSRRHRRPRSLLFRVLFLS